MRASIIVLAVAMLAACGSGSNSVVQPTAPQPTATLTADPTSVQSGAASTLTWSSTNATACTASGGWSGSEATSSGAGVATAALSASTSFTLTCTGAGGSAAATAAVTVTAPPPPPQPTVTLTANPTTVQSGATSTLTWSSTNATACTASGGWSGSEATGGNSATAALSGNTSFTLTCTGAGGSAAATAAVTVAPQPTVTVTANPTAVLAGQSTTLTWTSTNATTCTASGGWSGTEPTNGSASSAAVNAAATYTLTCTGPGGSAASSAMVGLTNPSSFTVTPRSAALTLLQSQQFSTTVSGGVTWTVDGIAGGSAAVGTISPGGLYTPPATAGLHTVVAISAANSALGGSAAVAVTDLAGIETFHVDLPRTGQNLHEYALTPATVSGGRFGKRWTCPVDGDVYAQPLYVANLAIGGGTHNVLFVATQNDSVYAFDADNPACVTYWQYSALTCVNAVVTCTAVAPIPHADSGGGCTDIPTTYGITGTPVIDPATQVMYFVAATKEQGPVFSIYYQRLHAISITTGAGVSGSPVVMNPSVVNHSGATVQFVPLQQNQRAALALYNGGVFVAWASHCDNNAWWGWLVKYDETTLAQMAVFNSTPNGPSSGGEGGIWMSAGAPAVDSAGSMFLTTGNGTFDDTADVIPAAAPHNDFAMSFLNMDTTTMSVQDFYTPSNESAWSTHDLDISSSGVTVLPDGAGPAGHPNVLVGSDKQSHLWMIDRTVGSMSGYSASADHTVQYLQLPYESDCPPISCSYDTPAYYAGTVYLAPSGAPLMALTLTNGLFSALSGMVVPTHQSNETYGFPGPTPMVSASPAGNALIWVLDNSDFQDSADSGISPAGPAILRAYDTGLITRYSSDALAADTAGNAVKFTVPVVANGHVYVGGGQQLTVYGMAP